MSPSIQQTVIANSTHIAVRSSSVAVVMLVFQWYAYVSRQAAHTIHRGTGAYLMNFNLAPRFDSYFCEPIVTSRVVHIRQRLAAVPAERAFKFHNFCPDRSSEKVMALLFLGVCSQKLSYLEDAAAKGKAVNL